MGDWLPIVYREFWDFPHAIVVEFRGQLLFLDCPFDREIDDYGDEFTVYALPAELKPVVNQPSWVGLEEKGRRVGSIPVSAIHFDPSKRKAIRFESLAGALGQLQRS